MWTKKELPKQSLNEKPGKRVLNMSIYKVWALVTLMYLL